MQVAATQQTPPSQLGMPVHVTPHATPEQLTRPLHAFIPLQPIVVVVVTVLETSAAQARAPEHSTEQFFPLHEIGCVHVSGFWHRMSHDLASHTMGPVQVSAAEHETLQLLPPQEIPCLHEPAPMQLMMHALAAVQSTVRVHEPPPVQVTVQGMPGGQTTGSSQDNAAVHVMMQVPLLSQVPTPASAQSDGHASIASTGVSVVSLASSRTSSAPESDVVESA